MHFLVSLIILESEDLSVESWHRTLAASCARCVFLAWMSAVLHCEVIFNGEFAMISYVT